MVWFQVLLAPALLRECAEVCAALYCETAEMAMAGSALHGGVELRCHEYNSESVVAGLHDADGPAAHRAFWSEMARFGVSEDGLRAGFFGEDRRTSAELQAAMVAHFLHYEWVRLRWDELIRPVLDGACRSRRLCCALLSILRQRWPRCPQAPACTSPSESGCGRSARRTS